VEGSNDSLLTISTDGQGRIFFFFFEKFDSFHISVLFFKKKKNF